MKCRYFALFLLITLATLLLVGCGGKTPSDDTVPSNPQGELYSSQSEGSSEDRTASSEQFTKGPDELEILTLPTDDGDENVSHDTPVENTEVTIPTSASGTAEPTFPFGDEKIDVSAATERSAKSFRSLPEATPRCISFLMEREMISRVHSVCPRMRCRRLSSSLMGLRSRLILA